MTEYELQKRFSENLKKLRKAEGLTQEKLAERAQISTQMINDIEGCRRWPSEKTITKIVNVLKIDVERLFEKEDAKKTGNSEIKKQICSEIKKIFEDSVNKYIGD
ncbi:MAG: helix-turn-helix transcriptional regulator [Treponema sp.]|nr:helix-turn-helix transcriptional regulator [Treponema sp.]